MKTGCITESQILNDKCYNELMHLRDLLRNFCIDAYSELAKLRELPRPPFNSPLIAGNEYLTHPLSKLSSHKLLQDYMRKSGLYDKLHNTGHVWYWHYEVFEWLFLERVIAESYENSFDIKVFNKVFSYASSELTRNSFRIRRITTLNGLPRLSNAIKLHTGLLLSPVKDGGYDLGRLLYSRFHNKDREPSLWVDSDSSLLVQDRVIVKEDRGNALLHVREQLDSETNMVIKTLKLCRARELNRSWQHQLKYAKRLTATINPAKAMGRGRL